VEVWDLVVSRPSGTGSLRLTAGMPHAHFVRGPSPGTFSGCETVEKKDGFG